MMFSEQADDDDDDDDDDSRKKYRRKERISSSLKAVPLLGRDLSPRRPRFEHGLVHVIFAVDKVALGQGFLQVLRFCPVRIIPLGLHTHISSGE
jgi:hypothetical protein